MLAAHLILLDKRKFSSLEEGGAAVDCVGVVGVNLTHDNHVIIMSAWCQQGVSRVSA